MTDNHDDDRREAYRDPPRPGSEPQLEIITEDERSIPDNIADINARGVKVEFDPGGAPSLVPGREITVGVEAPGLVSGAKIDARTVFAATQGERFVSAIAFATLPNEITNAGSEFFSIFNRRSSRRPVADSEKSGLSATVVTDLLSSAGHPVKIANYSKKGIGIVVTGPVSELLNTLDSFDLVLRSKRTAEVRRYTAHVVHRAQRDDKSYFGCLLVPNPEG